MEPLRLILLAAIFICATAKGGDTFKIDPSRSAIAFKVRHMLGAAKGKFTKFNGRLRSIANIRSNPRST